MANPFRDMGISDADLEREITTGAEVQRARKATAEEMVVYAQSIAPKRHATYAAGIRVVASGPTKATVGAMDWKSHMIEDGTNADPEGTHSRFGRDTPTPEFAVMARTADHFGHGSIEARIR